MHRSSGTSWCPTGHRTGCDLVKVGIVCPYDLMAPGGVQQLTRELADQLRLAGDDVVLVGAGTPPGGSDEVRVGRAIRIRANRSVAPITLSPWSWARVRRSLTDVDVIHVHEPFIPLVGWSAIGMDRPMVATFHADPPKWVPDLYRQAPLVGRKVRKSVITAVSETAGAALPEGWGPVEVVPNAIDVASYRVPVQRHANRVCFLGRDDPRKGLDILLRAWPRVRSEVPDAELMVMGTDRPEGPDGVEFLGRPADPEKRRVLASSLVYVAPNTGGESFGIVIAEGMAAGCAVVCSDLPAFRAVLGDDGQMVPVGDVPSLADVIIDLLKDPQAAQVFGDQARKSVDRFDWGVIATRYQLMYRRALS